MAETKLRKFQSPELRGVFLDAVLDGNSIADAVAITGINIENVYTERREDPTFNRQVNDALEIRGDLRGRPNCDAATKQAIIEDIRGRKVGAGIAAESQGISEAAMNAERRRDPDFDNAVRSAERFSVALVEDVLYQTALKGSIKAIEIILFNRAPDRWAAPRTLERRAADLERRAHAELDKKTETEGTKELSLAEKQAVVADLLTDIANRTPKT